MQNMAEFQIIGRIGKIDTAKGVTIAPLDLMIAAHALALDATLVSADQALSMIDILKVEDWSV